MSNYAQVWGEHLSESPIHAWVDAAIEGQENFVFELGDFSTKVVSELGVMQRHIHELSIAIDEINESLGLDGTA